MGKEIILLWGGIYFNDLGSFPFRLWNRNNNIIIIRGITNQGSSSQKKDLDGAEIITSVVPHASSPGLRLRTEGDYCDIGMLLMELCL